MPDVRADNAYRVEDKAASYQCVPGDIGKVLVTTAAATITLPNVADIWAGWNIQVYNAADDILVVAAEAGKLVTFNDIAANSVSFAGTGLMIGTALKFIYDATLTKWLVFVKAGETGALTITT